MDFTEKVEKEESRKELINFLLYIQKTGPAMQDLLIHK